MQRPSRRMRAGNPCGRDAIEAGQESSQGFRAGCSREKVINSKVRKRQGCLPISTVARTDCVRKRLAADTSALE